MSILRVLALLPLFGVLAAPASAQDDSRDLLRAALEKARRIHDRIVRPLTVNGQRLDPLEVERQTVYLVGQRLLQQKLIELIVEDQMQQQIEAGTPKKTFEVLEDEVKKQIAKTIEEFEKKNPGKKFWTELAKTGISREEYLTLQRSTLLFDKVFFRGIPAKWPDITKEAIIAAGGEQGQQFWDRFAESVKEGQEVPPLWLQICRQWVISKLKDWSDVRYASDGLPPEICLSVNGRVWRTEDAARALALKIKPEDRVRALVDIVLQTALRQELERKGFWLSDEEFREEFAKYREPFDKTPFTVEVLALSFKGYPSFEVYKARWRLERSFEKMIAKEINDETLGKHLERAKEFLGDGRVSVKAIRIPAFDDRHGRWKEHGWADAAALAEQVMTEIENGDLTFEQAFEKYSQWPEDDKEKGVLNSKSLNELRTSLKESEYYDFVQGYSIGEILFYDVEKGEVVGPLRGHDGYYIAKLVDRFPAAGTTSLEDPNQRDLVKQDYVSHRFIAWANEVARRTRVR